VWFVISACYCGICGNPLRNLWGSKQ
jgi:hypothetical protein